MSKTTTLMQLSKLLSVILPVLCAFSARTLADGGLRLDKPITSPNGLLSVSLKRDGEDEAFVIKNTQTGYAFPPVPIDTVLLAIKWMPTSRAFATVQHLAGGSVIAVVCGSAAYWSSYIVEAPTNPEIDLQAAEVVKWKLEGDTIHTTYCVESKVGNATSNYLCDFDINSLSGGTSNVHFHAISYAKRKRLKTQFPQE